jgi:hypothetical protein
MEAKPAVVMSGVSWPVIKFWLRSLHPKLEGQTGLLGGEGKGVMGSSVDGEGELVKVGRVGGGQRVVRTLPRLVNPRSKKSR